MSDRGFPILGGNGFAVPWAFIEPHDAQARANHYQTLRRLAERGGLSWCELRAVIEDRPWRKGEVTQDRDAVLSAVKRWRTREAIAAGIEIDAAMTTLRADNARLRAALETIAQMTTWEWDAAAGCKRRVDTPASAAARDALDG